MEDAVRVLVVEQRAADHRIAKQLLTDYDLEFKWQSAASLREMRSIAKAFDPGIVLCTDDLSTTSGQVLLGAMRLLCSRAPVILISSVRNTASAIANETERFLDTLRDGSPSDRVSNPRPPAFWQDTQHLRRCFSSILESGSEPIVMCDSDGWITHANTSACHQLEQLYGQSLGTLLNGPFVPRSRSANWLDAARDAIQERAFVTASCSRLRDAGSHRLAHFAGRTGPAPVHMNDLMKALSTRSRARQTAFALVAATLDHGRLSAESCVGALCKGGSISINSDLLSAPTRYGSVVRISQDDFLVILPDLCCPADAAITVQGVLDSIEQPKDLEPSIRDDKSAPQVKPRSHARDHVSRPKKIPLPLEMELADALQRHALSVQYQPQYDLKTGHGCGVEALARWVLSSGEIISPSVFIPVAERTGMIQDLGAWVLQSACEAAAEWCGRPHPLATLSVNVSALQIDRNFCSVIERNLKHYGFPAKQLELEITESALIANTDLAIEYLQEWKRLGVRIAVDDFGTGYSSLSYLSRLPVDRLKLDQSLVHMMTQSSKSVAVMRSIVSLGAELGIDVIAEGVETEQQFQMLTDLGCPSVQGYLLGRPMPAHQAQVVLRKTWGNRPFKAGRSTRSAMGEALAH
jgi:EAL domain-containing protein (putative c-di-GMP-specific phosphodiesterase class I)/PAS domain-containing protein